MIVLGISGFFHHDPAAALLADGRLIAAAEEERFCRVKHAPGRLPLEAARFCLEASGVSPKDVDALAFSWDLRAGLRAWPRHLRRMGHDPLRAFKNARDLWKRSRKIRKRLQRLASEIGLDARLVPVEHHLAHAASAFLFSGFDDASVFSADGRGELACAWAGEGTPEGLERLREWVLPDSLGMFYTSVTQYLGLPPNDGEYRTMGMAPYGDADKAELGDCLRTGADGFRVDGSAVGLSIRNGRGSRRLYADRFPARFGPPRIGDGLSEPHVHVAASAQKALEAGAVSAVKGALAGPLARSGRLCLAGGVAMNVVLNRRLGLLDGVDRVWVPPAPGDAGCAAGAAAWVARDGGDAIRPLESPFLGPAFSKDAVRTLLESRRLPFAEPDDPERECASLLARGEVAGWFQGAMEFGPRALGGRSILAHPGKAGTADRINASIKFREPWRPFCPSVLAGEASRLLVEPFDSPFMSFAFTVHKTWRDRIGETVHVDGTSRAQVVDRERAPGFHRLISGFFERTGIPAVLNTSLNRRGEPIACTPEDALDVFFGSGLEHLYLEGLRISKAPAAGGGYSSWVRGNEHGGIVLAETPGTPRPPRIPKGQ